MNLKFVKKMSEIKKMKWRMNSSVICIKDLTFADDKKIVRNKISSLNDAKSLQASIDKFVERCSNNQFELNLEKCKIMTISRKRCPILANYLIMVS